MAVVFNGITRQIEVTDPLIFELEAGKEIYSAWKRWQQLDPVNAGYAPALRTFGGDTTATGQTAPKYFFLINYWQVLINNGNIVSVALNLYSDDFVSPYVVVAGSGVSDRNSDAVNVNEEDIKRQSFLGAKVYINTRGLGVSGTEYPIGTPSVPVDNWEDAYAIAIANRFGAFSLRGDLTYTGASPSPTENIDLDSSNSLVTEVNFDGRSIDGSSFERIHITGTVVGRASYENCDLGGTFGLVGFDGHAKNSELDGDITLSATATMTIMFRDCVSDIAGTNRPTMNCNNTAADIGIRDYVGGLIITNFTSGNNMSFDSGSGVLELTSSCTAGVIVVRGTTQLIDNSGVGCSVIKEGTVTELVNAGASVWTIPEKDEVIQYSKKASDNAEQANLKL